MPIKSFLRAASAFFTETPAPGAADEANHRIANNLSMIAALVRMQASSLDVKPEMMKREDVRAAMTQLGCRIDAVARLHRLLVDQRREALVDVAVYLQDIAGGIVSSLSTRERTSLRFACDTGCAVAPERALWLGLIVGELVTNAIKHGHPDGVAGTVELECRRGPDGSLTIEVCDDGVGLPGGFEPTKDGDLGFRLVRTLVSQLGGTITFRHDLGLCCVLQSPLAAA